MKSPKSVQEAEAGDECGACSQCDSCCSVWVWVLALLFAVAGFLGNPLVQLAMSVITFLGIILAPEIPLGGI